MHAGLTDVRVVQQFAATMAARAAGRCSSIGNQALLNIALAAARLGVHPDILRPMTLSMAKVLTARAICLNQIDLRQWIEIQRYCGLPGSATPSVGSQDSEAASALQQMWTQWHEHQQQQRHQHLQEQLQHLQQRGRDASSDHSCLHDRQH